eukprot:4675531-Amphidinium_carterae.1
MFPLALQYWAHSAHGVQAGCLDNSPWAAAVVVHATLEELTSALLCQACEGDKHHRLSVWVSTLPLRSAQPCQTMEFNSVACLARHIMGGVVAAVAFQAPPKDCLVFLKCSQC